MLGLTKGISSENWSGDGQVRGGWMRGDVSLSSPILCVYEWGRGTEDRSGRGVETYGWRGVMSDGVLGTV